MQDETLIHRFDFQGSRVLLEPPSHLSFPSDVDDAHLEPLAVVDCSRGRFFYEKQKPDQFYWICNFGAVQMQVSIRGGNFLLQFLNDFHYMLTRG